MSSTWRTYETGSDDGGGVWGWGGVREWGISDYYGEAGQSSEEKKRTRKWWCAYYGMSVLSGGGGAFLVWLWPVCVCAGSPHTHPDTCVYITAWRAPTVYVGEIITICRNRKVAGLREEAAWTSIKKKKEDKLQPVTKNTTPVPQFLYLFIWLFYKITDCWNESQTHEQRFSSLVPASGDVLTLQSRFQGCPVLFLLSLMTCTGSE